jgi:hypothetical protein
MEDGVLRVTPRQPGENPLTAAFAQEMTPAE